MGTGPEVTGGHDLVPHRARRRLPGRGRHARPAAPSWSGCPLRPATAAEQYGAAATVAAVRAADRRPGPAVGLHDRLLAQLDHPRWAQVAERCITVRQLHARLPDLLLHDARPRRPTSAGGDAVTSRTWDSCFSPGFAKVAGGSFRSRHRDRYRQWLTHKFATWWDQFGMSGCVGCGRCITWCPVGIDVRDELNAIAPRVPLRRPRCRSSSRSPATAERLRRRPRRRDEGGDGRHDDAHPDRRPTRRFAKGSTGQFAMVALPGFPPLPISISRFLPDGIELTIRGAGPATKAMCALQVGDQLGPARPARQQLAARARCRAATSSSSPAASALRRSGRSSTRSSRDRRRFGDVRLFYGARTPADLLYRRRAGALGRPRRHRGRASPSTAPDRSGAAAVGIVTHLFDQATWDGAEHDRLRLRPRADDAGDGRRRSPAAASPPPAST